MLFKFTPAAVAVSWLAPAIHRTAGAFEGLHYEPRVVYLPYNLDWWWLEWEFPDLNLNFRFPVHWNTPSSGIRGASGSLSANVSKLKRPESTRPSRIRPMGKWNSQSGLTEWSQWKRIRKWTTRSRWKRIQRNEIVSLRLKQINFFALLCPKFDLARLDTRSQGSHLQTLKFN